MGRWRAISRAGIGVAVLAALASCDVQTLTSATPRARPAVLVEPVIEPTSEKSAALRSYLRQVQTAQLKQELLRQDGGGPDTPFSADMLAQNFEQIVFYNEYESALQGRGGQSPLRRWDAPVRMQVIFGPKTPPSQRGSDDAIVRNYAKRLSKITGHSIGTFGTPNFIVVIANEDDRSAALDEAATRVPGITPKSLDALRTLNRNTYCAVIAYPTAKDPNTYAAAVAIIRAENPPLLRTSCIHEELAQGLGLANDSRDARPSIFNDDDEFALLTDHDELLLKMLYDPRLSIGMTAVQAAPVTRIIARELMSGPL